jgi:hypothetical protein
MLMFDTLINIPFRSIIIVGDLLQNYYNLYETVTFIIDWRVDILLLSEEKEDLGNSQRSSKP